MRPFNCIHNREWPLTSLVYAGEMGGTLTVAEKKVLTQLSKSTN